MLKEEYKDIPDNEFVPLKEGVDPVFWGKYKINKLGQIWSIKYNKILSPILDDRYYKIQLSTTGEEGVRLVKTYRVHRLVASQFVINLNPDLNVVVDHLDRNSENNNASNLKWTTTKENNNNRKQKIFSHTITRVYYKVSDSGDVIEKIPISEMRGVYYSKKITKAIRDSEKLDGFYWRCVTTSADEVYTKYGYNPEWKESISLPGLYVSNLGTIKRGLVETLGSDRRGYYVASIDSLGKSFSMNRLIAETFVVGRKLEANEVVDHINTNRLDNRSSNLRVCSQKENMNNPITVQKLSKAVLKYSLSGELLDEFPSLTKACESIGIKRDNNCIRLCCEGKILKSHGYIWKYKN